MPSLEEEDDDDSADDDDALLLVALVDDALLWIALTDDCGGVAFSPVVENDAEGGCGDCFD